MKEIAIRMMLLEPSIVIIMLRYMEGLVQRNIKTNILAAKSGLIESMSIVIKIVQKTMNEDLNPILSIERVGESFHVYASRSNGRKFLLASVDDHSDKKKLSSQIGRCVVAYFDMLDGAKSKNSKKVSEVVSFSEVLLLVERIGMGDAFEQIRVIDSALLALIESGDAEAIDFYNSIWRAKKREIILAKKP